MFLVLVIVVAYFKTYFNDNKLKKKKRFKDKILKLK